MANLKITKKVSVSGDMEIYLDDQMLGVVSDYETKMFDVPLGEHKIRAKLKWLGSAENTFVFTEDHTLVLTVSNKKWINYFTYIYTTLLLILFLFHSTYKLSKIYLLFLFLPPWLVFMFVFTIGRNKRMVIGESKFKK